MKSEFEFIKSIKQTFDLKKIGDDCAVMPLNSSSDQVITADMLVEDIDFRLEWSTPEYIGHRALAVSLSDVFAMGARPVWSMISIGVPAKIWKTDFVENFYRGYMALAKTFKIELVGGDVSETPDKIVIDSIAGGSCPKGKAVLRSGAKVGDAIFVSGALGGAAAGLRLLENGFRLDSETLDANKSLLLKQLRPVSKAWSKYPAGLTSLVNSMIDISDGLSSDLLHICQSSGVGARIYADKIPLHWNLGTVAASLDEKLDLALNGGEDFELLFTADQKNLSEKFLRDFHLLGEITEHTGIIELITDGVSTVLDPKGFVHF